MVSKKVLPYHFVHSCMICLAFLRTPGVGIILSAYIRHKHLSNLETTDENFGCNLFLLFQTVVMMSIEQLDTFSSSNTSPYPSLIASAIVGIFLEALLPLY